MAAAAAAEGSMMIFLSSSPGKVRLVLIQERQLVAVGVGPDGVTLTETFAVSRRLFQVYLFGWRRRWR